MIGTPEMHSNAREWSDMRISPPVEYQVSDPRNCTPCIAYPPPCPPPDLYTRLGR